MFIMARQEQLRLNIYWNKLLPKRSMQHQSALMRDRERKARSSRSYGTSPEA